MTAFNQFLYQWRGDGRRPPGVMDARVKTEYVACVRVRPNGKLHRPKQAFIHTTTGAPQLAARFLCGEASTNVHPASGNAALEACERCEELSQGTPRWAVYAYRDAAGRVLYVGQSCNLTIRRRSHAAHSPWSAQAATFSVLSYHDTRLAALDAEAKAIRELHPIHNIRHNQKAVSA